MAAVAAALISAVPEGRAQTMVLMAGGTPDSAIGESISGAGDLNGDGNDDFLAGTPSFGSLHERVIAFSGTDGSHLFVLLSPTPKIGFGKSVDGGSDVDADGVADVLVGAWSGSAGNPYPVSQGNGSVWVYSGATRQLIRTHAGLPQQRLGHTVAFVGDVNSDSVPDYAAGATHDFYGQPGEVVVYSGQTGQALRTITAGLAADMFGGSIEPLGDVDLDGVSDIAVGASETSAQGFAHNGAVRIYSGATGTLIKAVFGVESGDSIGRGIARLGDINGDGRADFVTNGFGSIPAPSGQKAIVRSGWTGEVLTVIQADPIGAMKESPDSIADLDGDGYREVIIIAANLTGGHVLIANAVTGEHLFRAVDPRPRDIFFPWKVASVGDVDGDALEDWAATDITDGLPGDPSTGLVYVYSGRPLYALETDLSASGGMVPFDLNGGVPRSSSTYFLIAGFSGTSPGFNVGITHVPLNYDLLTAFSISLSNSVPFLDTVGSLDAYTGKGEAAFDLTNIPLPPSAIGLTLYFAYVAKGGTGGVPAWHFASNPTAVVIVP